MRREEVGLKDWLGYKIRFFREPFDEVPQGSFWHTCRDGEIWDLIAWLYYRDEEKWYIIADVNGVSDPFEPLEGGHRIVIPRL